MKFLIDNKKSLLYIFLAGTILAMPTLAQPLRYLGPFTIVKFLISIGLFCLPALVLEKYRRTYFILSIPFLVIGFFELGYFIIFKTAVTPSIYSTTLSSDPFETIGFIIQYGRLAGIILLLISIIYFFLVKRVTADKFSPTIIKYLSTMIVVGAIIYGGLSINKDNYISTRIYPFTVARKLKIFFDSKKQINMMKQQRLSHKYTIDTQNVPERKVVVIVVGETASRGSFSLYGYKFNTTPELLKRKDELAIFTNVISPASQTIDSLKIAFSEAEPENPNLFYQRKSVLSIANDAGYETYWISNQYSFGKYETETTVIANDAKNTIFLNNKWRKTKFDDGLIESFTQNLGKEKKQLFIIHMMGSHSIYSDRYPKSFSNVVNEKDDRERIVKEYDTSIRYTDFILNKIISNLNNKKEIGSFDFLFFSDHGEAIFNDKNNASGHGLPILTKIQVEVPFIYMGKHKGFNKDVKASLTDTFHTIVELLGVKFKGMKKNRSLINRNYIESNQSVLDINGNLHFYKDL